MFGRSAKTSKDTLPVASKVYPNATIIVVAVGGFVGINEAPAQQRSFVNIAELVQSSLIRHGGDVVQSAGDTCVCIFDSSQSDAAIEAAITITSRSQEISASVGARVGIATGQLIVTSVGDHARPLHSIIGAAFHLASKLQKQSNKTHPILICGETARLSRMFDAHPITLHDSSGESIEAFALNALA